MSRKYTKKKTNAEKPIIYNAKKETEEIGTIISKEEMEKIKTEQIPSTENSIDDLLIQNPLYTEEASVEDMNKSNWAFYEQTNKKAFDTAIKEEKTQLDELLHATYYPASKQEAERSDFDLVKSSINIVR